MDLLSCLKAYRKDKREYDEAVAGFSEIVAELRAGFDQRIEELREKFLLEEREKKMLDQRTMVEVLAFESFGESGEKTVYDDDGFKVQVAVSEKPLIINDEKVIDAIIEAQMAQHLAPRKIVMGKFKKWAKVQKDLGVDIPGLQWVEEKQVRITLPTIEQET